MIFPLSLPRVYYSGPGFVFQAAIGGKAAQWEISEDDIDGLIKSAVTAREWARKQRAAA